MTTDPTEATTCINRAKRIGTGIQIFLADYDNVLSVTEANWKERIMPYIKHAEVFTCPVDSHEQSSFSLNPRLIDKNLSKPKNPQSTVLIYEGTGGALRAPHDGRGVVVFADTSTRLLTPAEFSKVWQIPNK